MLKLSFCFLFSIICFNSIGQEYLKSIKQTQALSIEVTELFKENKLAESFEKLSKYWPIPTDEIEDVKSKTIKYLNIYNERFGSAIGSLKIKNEVITDIATRETFLIRFDRTAIRLIFTYYKNNDGWIVNSFKWDDSFDEEFK